MKNAPLEYLRSGIGDTLAKYYEIRRRLTDDQIHSLSLSLAASLVDGFADLDGRSVAAHTFYNAYSRSLARNALRMVKSLL